MGSIHGWWFVVPLAIAGVTVAGGAYLQRKRVESTPERGGNMDELNRLLQEGSISPDEYDLLKRRLLAGHVA